MVDRLRAYRRWRSRRLGLLVPVFLGALGTQLWLAAGSTAPAWLRVVSLGTSSLVVALIGYFLAQTLFCAVLHARGNRAGARVIREQLAPSGRAALAAAALLAMLNTIPYLIPADPGKPPSLPFRRAFRFRPDWSAPAVVPLNETEIDAPPSAEIAEAPKRSRPDVHPIQEILPLHLAVEENESRPDVSAVLAFLNPPQEQPDRRPAAEEEEGYPRYRPDAKDGFQLVVESESSTGLFARLGVPDQGHPDEWLLPELRLEVTLFKGADSGAEYSLQFDVPISREESIRTNIAVARVGSREYLEESASESWQRVTIAYTVRAAGYTRQAPFDLAFSIGLAADRYRLSGADGPMDPGTRLSPYVAVDAAIWQQGTAGLILHAGYSIPVNVTGGSSGVLDLAATIRIDLTENVSLHAGYRYLVVRLRDYEEAYFGSGSRGDFSTSFSGPLVGMDLRF